MDYHFVAVYGVGLPAQSDQYIIPAESGKLGLVDWRQRNWTADGEYIVCRRSSGVGTTKEYALETVLCWDPERF